MRSEKCSSLAEWYVDSLARAAEVAADPTASPSPAAFALLPSYFSPFLPTHSLVYTSGV